jgi:hypothetical protein
MIRRIDARISSIDGSCAFVSVGFELGTGAVTAFMVLAAFAR